MADLTQHVQVARDGRIARLILNRPEAFNAFGIDMAEELWHRLADIARDDQADALVITGAGRAFCAGENRSPRQFAAARQQKDARI